MLHRGNGYYVAERGRFNASLVYDGEEIAGTDSDLVIGYGKYARKHGNEIRDWADEYGYDIEWR